MLTRVSFVHGETKYEFEFDEKDEKTSLLLSIVLGNPKKDCYLVKSGHTYCLQANKDTDGNIYINNYCTGFDEGGKRTRAVSKLGEYKSGGFYWNDWQIDQFFNKKPKKDS